VGGGGEDGGQDQLRALTRVLHSPLHIATWTLRRIPVIATQLTMSVLDDFAERILIPRRREGVIGGGGGGGGDGVG
jgi:hypothetical protein